jgi:hypothetical protein
MADPELMIRQAIIKASEPKHASLVLMKFEELTRHFESSYDLFLISVNESRCQHDLGNEITYNWVFMEMCMKINSDIRVIYSAILSGWYETANALFREVSDTLEKIMFISKYPERAEKIKSGALNQKTVRAILKKAKISPPLGDRAWGQISQSKHAEGGKLGIYGQKTKQGRNIRFLPIPDYDLVEALLIFSIGLLTQVAIEYRDFHIAKYGNIFSISAYASDVDSMALFVKNKMLHDIEGNSDNSNSDQRSVK